MVVEHAFESKKYFPMLHNGCRFLTFLQELKFSELGSWKAFLQPVIPITFCGLSEVARMTTCNGRHLGFRTQVSPLPSVTFSILS